jgi:hypothetical protein
MNGRRRILTCYSRSRLLEPERSRGGRRPSRIIRWCHAQKRAGRGVLGIAQALARIRQSPRRPPRPIWGTTCVFTDLLRRRPVVHRRGARAGRGAARPRPLRGARHLQLRQLRLPGGVAGTLQSLVPLFAWPPLAQRVDRPSAAREAKRLCGLTAFRAGRYRLHAGQIGRISDSPEMRAIAEEDRNARLLDVALQGS